MENVFVLIITNKIIQNFKLLCIDCTKDTLVTCIIYHVLPNLENTVGMIVRVVFLAFPFPMTRSSALVRCLALKVKMLNVNARFLVAQVANTLVCLRLFFIFIFRTHVGRG